MSQESKTRKYNKNLQKERLPFNTEQLFTKRKKKCSCSGVPVMAQRERIWLVSMRDAGSFPRLAQWVKDLALL